MSVTGCLNGNLYYANLYNSHKNTTYDKENVHAAIIIFLLFFKTQQEIAALSPPQFQE